VRQTLTAILSQERGVTVAVAADPLIARGKIARERPDVIVLDLEMPRMDGLTFLRRLMSEDPIPVVVCSGFAGNGTRGALRAIEEGAVAVVPKPKLGLRGFLHDSRLMLVDTVRGAAQARLQRRVARPAPLAPHVTGGVTPSPGRGATARQTAGGVVAIGASTGGPEALRAILEAMPSACPAIVIVQHMPEGFTRAFAERLDQECQIEVKEAGDGDAVRPGRALLAPGNRHVVLVRRDRQYILQVRDGPLVSRHRPSVDVLFRSVAQVAGMDAIGVLLTGMGDDGADGLLEMKRAGAPTIAQDETTSVVFGMPREAVARGAADEVLPLPAIAAAILRPLRRALPPRP
jgi:two-component system, chemotaxis family, protein-glutamate methylesterase/glutaminase